MGSKIGWLGVEVSMYEKGEIVKVISVGHMYSSDDRLARKLGATRWRTRKPFNRALEGQHAVIRECSKTSVLLASRKSAAHDFYRYLIEFNDGEQYIIGEDGICKVDFILPDDLFEI